MNELPPTTPTFAEKIRHAREKMGLSQTTLARRCGVSRSTVNHLESGQQAVLWSTVQLIAKALRLDLNDLIDPHLVLLPAENRPMGPRGRKSVQSS